MAEGAAMEERPGEPVGPPPGPPLDLPLDPSPEERVDEPWEDGEQPFRVLHVSQPNAGGVAIRSEEHTSELQSRENLACRLLLEKKNTSSGIQARRAR